MTTQTDEHRALISRADNGPQWWSPLASHMGYTRTREQRDAILAAIRRMTWIAMRLPHASLLIQINPAACTIAAALTHASPLRSAAIALVEPGQRLIGLADVTGARHYLLDLRVEAIHVLTEPSTTSEQMPGYGRRHATPPVATPTQSVRLFARSATMRVARDHAGVIGFQRTSRTAR